MVELSGLHTLCKLHRICNDKSFYTQTCFGSHASPRHGVPCSLIADRDKGGIPGYTPCGYSVHPSQAGRTVRNRAASSTDELLP